MQVLLKHYDMLILVSERYSEYPIILW